MAIDANSAFVLGSEVAARRGPLSLQGEYLHAFVNRASVTFPGLYLAASYLLTGETRPYDREATILGKLVLARPLNLHRSTAGCTCSRCASSWWGKCRL